MTIERDRAPIDQCWIHDRVDSLLTLAGRLTEGSAMQQAVLRRVEYYMDLVDAWQLRQLSPEEQERLLAAERRRHEEPTS